MYRKFNLHLTNRCNYNCKYCFGKFDSEELPLSSSMAVIDNIADYFRRSGIENGDINLAGGEPLLYRALDDIIDHAREHEISVSIVTNGSLLTRERVRAFKGKINCIGISIDSQYRETNLLIGRCCKQQCPALDFWRGLAEEIHACKIKLKINTVVSRYNIDEDLLPLYDLLSPERIKLLKMHSVKGVNDKAVDKAVTEEEFRSFCKNNTLPGKRTETVCEGEEQMENSYLMIDPKGDFILNDKGRYISYGNCIEEPITEILGRVPIIEDRFSLRYTNS